MLLNIYIIMFKIKPLDKSTHDSTDIANEAFWEGIFLTTICIQVGLQTKLPVKNCWSGNQLEYDSCYPGENFVFPWRVETLLFQECIPDNDVKFEDERISNLISTTFDY